MQDFGLLAHKENLRDLEVHFNIAVQKLSDPGTPEVVRKILREKLPQITDTLESLRNNILLAEQRVDMPGYSPSPIFRSK
jgi:hypothetical protein